MIRQIPHRAPFIALLAACSGSSVPSVPEFQKGQALRWLDTSPNGGMYDPELAGCTKTSTYSDGATSVRSWDELGRLEFVRDTDEQGVDSTDHFTWDGPCQTSWVPEPVPEDGATSVFCECDDGGWPSACVYNDVMHEVFDNEYRGTTLQEIRHSYRNGPLIDVITYQWNGRHLERETVYPAGGTTAGLEWSWEWSGDGRLIGSHQDLAGHEMGATLVWDQRGRHMASLDLEGRPLQSYLFDGPDRWPYRILAGDETVELTYACP